MKGLVSCLGMSSEGVLAAGTFTRWVGLYDSGGSGGTVGVFEIKSGDGDMDEVGDGTGITQVLWSECGRYLCVVERGSNGVGVWDIRGTGRRLSWLNGRKARTGQRLGAEVVGTNVWAGGLDGNVRVWEGLGRREGVVAPNQDFKVHDGECFFHFVTCQCPGLIFSCGRRCLFGRDASFRSSTSNLFRSKTSTRLHRP